MNLKMQSLATCNNHYCTGQYNKALNLLTQLMKIYPEDSIASDMFESIIKDTIKETVGFSFIGEKPHHRDFSDLFGFNWSGTSLDGKSITIFCDQGMGDILNMLRYVEALKKKWHCTIYLNCYSFFNEFEEFFKHISFVDYFVNDYIKTDFHTNIFSIASILNGFDYEIHYPVHFKDLLKTEIPKQILTFPNVISSKMGSKIGLAWKSNSKNPLSERKSIDLSLFESFGIKFCSLIPEKTNSLFLIEPIISNVLDTVALIKGLDLVISVDTMVLHLAGLLGKKTIGLLANKADPRWGYGASTSWYDSVRLYRSNGDWGQLLDSIFN